MMSVAVRDEQGNITQTADGGMAANLLLASEVRGYINRPDLYFVRNDAAHRRMLDLLLRVQGGQANTFDVVWADRVAGSSAGQTRAASAVQTSGLWPGGSNGACYSRAD